MTAHAPSTTTSVAAQVAGQAGEFAEGVAGVGDAVETAFEEGHAVRRFKLARDVEQRLGAHHHAGFGAMHGLHRLALCWRGQT